MQCYAISPLARSSSHPCRRPRSCTPACRGPSEEHQFVFGQIRTNEPRNSTRIVQTSRFAFSPLTRRLAHVCGEVAQHHESSKVGSNPVRVAIAAGPCWSGHADAATSLSRNRESSGLAATASAIALNRLRCGLVHFEMCAHFLHARSEFCNLFPMITLFARVCLTTSFGVIRRPRRSDGRFMAFVMPLRYALALIGVFH